MAYIRKPISFGWTYPLLKPLKQRIRVNGKKKAVARRVFQEGLRFSLQLGMAIILGLANTSMGWGALPPSFGTDPAEPMFFSSEHPLPKTWTAFEKVSARNVCVRVNNVGDQVVMVWMRDQQSVVGLFSVEPQHISGMCSLASKIELSCSGEDCESQWSIIEQP